MKTLALVAIFIFIPFISGSAFAIGEIFKAETTGTEYCGDFDFEKFSAQNNVDLWVAIMSDTEIIVSLTPDFESGTIFPMYGKTYLIAKNKAAFIGGILFQDQSYALIQGTATLDKFGTVKSMQGTFMQDSVLNVGCFSSGKFKTVQRLQ
jgi:hypothetical protein